MSQAAELGPVKDKGKQLGSFFKERFVFSSPRDRKKKKKPKGRIKKLTEFLYLTPTFSETQNDGGNKFGK